MRNVLLTAGTAMLLTTAANSRVVPAWTASQQKVWTNDFLFPTNIPVTLQDRTLRQIVRVGIGGRSVQVVLSNAAGDTPVTVAAVNLAPSAGAGRIVAEADRALRFGGARSVTIPAGGSLISDPVSLTIAAGQDLAVSIYFRKRPLIDGFHWDGRRTGYVLSGDALSSADPKVMETTTARLLLAAVLVEAPEARGTTVVLGDSITDGAGATLDLDARWPDLLARRAAPRGIAVVNAGISGARLLSAGMGSAALARLDRDVLAQPGVRTLILMLGTNDIAWPGTPFDPDAPPTTLDGLAAGYRGVVARARANGLRVIGATIPPFADALPGTPLASTYYSPAKDALRLRVNDWIRSSRTFDAVVDLDLVLRDPAKPGHLLPAFDSGDHLHPGDAGNQAMADAVDLDTLIGEAR